METKIPPVLQLAQSLDDMPKVPPIRFNCFLEHEKAFKWKSETTNSFPENFDPLLWEMQRRAHDIFQQNPQIASVEIKANFWAGNCYHDLPTFVFQNNNK